MNQQATDYPLFVLRLLGFGVIIGLTVSSTLFELMFSIAKEFVITDPDPGSNSKITVPIVALLIGRRSRVGARDASMIKVNPPLKCHLDLRDTTLYHDNDAQRWNTIELRWGKSVISFIF